jgi:hypothetical protein
MLERGIQVEDAAEGNGSFEATTRGSASQLRRIVTGRIPFENVGNEAIERR